MKTFRFLGIAIAALFMTVNFTSCNNEGITPEDQEEKYIEVDLACVGEILDITNSPLSKTGTYPDLYTIVVSTLTPMAGTGTGSHYQETPYANGTFSSSLNGVTIRLLEGNDYRFKVSIVIDDMKSSTYTSREFNYSQSYWGNPSVPTYNEGYYGELDKYTPVEGSTVTIETKRVSYGAKFIAEGLTEGSINVSVSPSTSMTLYSVNLTVDAPVSDRIYSFSQTSEAWRGIPIWDNSMMEPIGYSNYSAKKYLNVTWTKADGSVIPLGTFDVTFERNVKTTIRIKAEVAGSSNGITVIKETNPIVDGDKEYVISGGTVTEVPVNSGN